MDQGRIIFERRVCLLNTPENRKIEHDNTVLIERIELRG